MAAVYGVAQSRTRLKRLSSSSSSSSKQRRKKKLILPALSPALSQGSALKDVQGDLRVTFLFAFKCAHARQESGSFHREEHMSMCLSPARLHGGLCQSSQTHSPESYFTKALTAPSLIA